jgi:hypothetical protein
MHNNDRSRKQQSSPVERNISASKQKPLYTAMKNACSKLEFFKTISCSM